MGREWKTYEAAPPSLWERVREAEDERRSLAAEISLLASELQAMGAGVTVFDEDDVIVLPGASRSLSADVGELETQVLLLRSRLARLEVLAAEARASLRQQQGEMLGWKEF